MSLACYFCVGVVGIGGCDGLGRHGILASRFSLIVIPDFICCILYGVKTQLMARAEIITEPSPETASWEVFHCAQPFNERLANNEIPPSEKELRALQRHAEEALPSVMRSEYIEIVKVEAEPKSSSPVVSSAARTYGAPPNWQHRIYQSNLAL